MATQQEIYNALETHFTTNWVESGNAKTKIVYPNTSRDLFNATYADSQSFVVLKYQHANTELLGLPVNQNTKRIQYYMFFVRIYTIKDRGPATTFVFINSLDTLYNAQSINQSNVALLFETSNSSIGVEEDDTYYVSGWSIPFHVFN